MLYAVPQALVEQASQLASAPTNQPKIEHTVPQQAAVPAVTPAISAPESLPPKPLPKVPLVAPAGTVQTVNSPSQTDRAKAIADQQRLLEQKLADIVAREKPLKDAQLRERLKQAAIAYAQAGQLDRARQTAQDALLPADVQADLLAQIQAIAASRSPVASLPTLPIKALPTPKQPKLLAKSPRSSGLPRVVAPESPRYVLPTQPTDTQPEIVGYSMSGFGRTLGGIGIVIDDNSPESNGYSWSAYSNGRPLALPGGPGLLFPLTIPAPITSAFGWRVHPITGDRRFHSGVDLGAPMGTPVVAAYAGKVMISDLLNGYGLAIVLSHNNDTLESLYGHLSQVFVKPGQWVEKGTVIGKVGSTGMSTGPHLHFELRQPTPDGWQAVDPGAQLEYALAQLVKVIQSG